MLYHMRDCKHIKPAQAGETLAQALLVFAFAMSATALALAIGAAVVCT